MTAIHTDKYGIATLPPGHAAGMANVRTYLQMLRIMATGAGIVLAVAAVAWMCLVVAASAVGSDMVGLVVLRTAAAIDWTDASAVIAGAALALTTGVPMGFYLFGRMAGWSHCPYDDE